MTIIAILPAYNLENNIEKIIRRTIKFVDKVIIVSDGSTDNTHLKAKIAGAICPPHTNIRGKGFAIRKGIKYSKKFNPRYIILMDANGQHCPEEINKLMYPILNRNVDMVIGSRIKGKIETSIINKLGNYFLKLISFIITGKWFSDTESGFKAFKSEILYSLELNSNHYEIESELLLKGLHNKFKIVEVPITVPFAVPGITVLDGIRVGIYKIRMGLKLKFAKVKS